MSEAPPKKSKRAPKPLLININSTKYPIIRRVMEEMGYKATKSDTKCHIFWCDSGGSTDIASSLEAWQFYNHFPGMWSISKKVELARNYERLQRLAPEIFNFHPKTFILPAQHNELRSFMLSSKKKKMTFIIKPDQGCQGRGLILFQDPDVASEYINLAVAQQYIPPYLIRGLKFDLRIYVLVTSVDPLVVYIHREGMARFCTEPYQPPRANNLEHSFAHLTNYAINKTNEGFHKNEDGEDMEAHKRGAQSVYAEMKAAGVDVNKLQEDIDNIIRLTIISARTHLIHTTRSAVKAHDGRCRLFEILGFDIFIDNQTKPWLLEVNNMPSLTTGSKFDADIKKSVVKGTFQILNIKRSFKKLIKDRQRMLSQMRVNKEAKENTSMKYDIDAEIERSKQTNWRNILPLKPGDKHYEMIEKVMKVEYENPAHGTSETAASRARKEAVSAMMKEQKQAERPKAHPAKAPASAKAKKPMSPHRNRLFQEAIAFPIRSKASQSVRTPTLSRTGHTPKSTRNLDLISHEEEDKRMRAILQQIKLGRSLGLSDSVRIMLMGLNGGSGIQPLPLIQRGVIKKPPIVSLRQISLVNRK